MKDGEGEGRQEGREEGREEGGKEGTMNRAYKSMVSLKRFKLCFEQVAIRLLSKGASGLGNVIYEYEFSSSL